MSKRLLKTTLTISLLTLIGFFAYYAVILPTRDAWADSDDPNLSPLRGWAWADTVGWFSFNCRDTGLCSTTSYIVSVSDTESPANIFKLQGHAWSNNFGWLSFDNGSDTDCPAAPRPCGNCSACYNRATNKIEGWAKLLALKNGTDPSYGWLELSVNANNPGVSVVAGNGNISQSDWGDLTGWGWNGYGDKSGIGWFNVNCLTGGSAGSDVCSTANYKVSARPDQPAINSIGPTPGRDSESIDITWTPVYGATAYEILRQDYVCSGDNTRRCTKNFDDTCPGLGSCNQLTSLASIDTVNGRSTDSYSDDDNIVEFATYIYRIRAKNTLGAMASAANQQYTVSPIGINDLNVSGICQAPVSGADGQIFIDLSWTAYYTFNAGLIENYNIEYCATRTDGTCSELDFVALPNITAPVATNPSQWRHVITDNLGDTNDLYSRLKASEFITYRVRAVGRDQVCIAGPNVNNPCIDSSDCAGQACQLRETCQGGDNDGLICASDVNCPNADPSDPCGPSKSAWRISSPKQICARGTQYQEVRPNN